MVGSFIHNQFLNLKRRLTFSEFKWLPLLPMLRKWLVRIFIVLFVLILILSAILWTQTGSRFLVEKIAAHYNFELEGVQGNLIEGFDIAQLSYVAPTEIPQATSATQINKLYARQLSFRWQPLGLFYTAIKLQRVSIDELSIHWTSPSNNISKQEWPSFAQPFLIELNQIRVKKLALQHNEHTYAFENLEGGITLGAFNFQLNQARVSYAGNSISADGKIATDFPYTFSLKGVHKIDGNPQNIVSHYNLNGDLARFKLDAVFQLESATKLEVASDKHTDQLKLIATVSTGVENKANKLLALIKRPLNKSTASPSHENPFHADLEFSFFNKNPETAFHSQALQDLSNVEVSARASLSINQPLSQISNLTIEFTDWQTKMNVWEQPVTLAIAGTMPVKWNEKGLVDVQLNIASATISAHQNEKLTTSKTLNRVQTTGNISLSVQLPIEKLQFSVEAFQTNLKLKLEKVSPAAIHKNITGEINGGLDLNLQFKPTSGIVGEVSNISLTGFVMNQALAVNGMFSWSSGIFSGANLKGAWGKSELHVNGSTQKQQLEWDFKIPDLKSFQPLFNESVQAISNSNNQDKAAIVATLQGEINSHGNFSGDFKHPRIEINTAVKNLVWNEISIDSLDVSIKPNKGSEHQLNLQAKAISGFGNRIDQFNVKSLGSLDQHYLSFVIQSNFNQFNSAQFNSMPNGVVAKIQGDVVASFVKPQNKKWQDLIWQGQWKALTVNVNDLPTWRLASADNFKISQTKMDIANLCLALSKTDAPSSSAQVFEQANYSAINKQLLRNQSLIGSRVKPQDTRLCITAAANLAATPQQNVWSAQLDLTGLPAEIFNAWLKTDTHLVGYSDGRLDISQKPHAFVKAKMNIQSRDLALVYQFQDEAAEIYRVNEAFINAELNNKALEFQTRWDLGQYGYLNGKGNYQLSTQKIQAKWDAQLNNLSPFEAVVPLLNNLEGKAILDLSVNGTLESPRLTGIFSIENATAKIPSLGLSFKNMQLHANSLADESIHLDARVTSGEGTLVVNGSLENLGKKNWRWDSNIFGANIQAIENPLLSATINPNLRLQATATNVALTGSTEIPWARAVMKTLPASATRLSKDVVLVNSKTAANSGSYAQSLGKKIDAQTNFFEMPFTSNLLVYFGDDVRFKGFGLDSQLIGKVNVLKETNRQVFTTGFVGVGKGNYKAYGQELKIERGRLIFQGPYDNPGLDIRAIRELENTSAGLEIGGTLQQPKSSVFSIPASTPSEAMALLVTGKPLAQSSQADAYALLGAISNLGMDDGDSMTTDIAHRFSLDELGIKADKGIEQSSLLVGKYVTPKLFIRYVVGLFDQAFSVGMRYQLNEKFRLEAESGKAQSIDVIYKIEQ